MLLHQFGDELDPVNVAVGGHLVGDTQDQLAGEQVDELPCLLFQRLDGIDIAEQGCSDAVDETHLVAQVLLDLLYRHVALRDRGDGFNAVQARFLGIFQDVAGVAVPVGEGIVILVLLVQQFVAVQVVRQHIFLEQSGGQGAAVDVVTKVDPLKAGGTDHVDEAVMVGLLDLEIFLNGIGHIHEGIDRTLHTHGVIVEGLDGGTGEVNGTQAVFAPDLINLVVLFLVEAPVLVVLDVHLDFQILLILHPPLFKILTVVGTVAAGDGGNGTLGGLDHMLPAHIVQLTDIALDVGRLHHLHSIVILIDPVGAAQGFIKLPDAHAGIGGRQGFFSVFSVFVPADDPGLPQDLAARFPADNGTV